MKFFHFAAHVVTVRRRRHVHGRREQQNQLRRHQGALLFAQVRCRVAQAVAGQAALRVPGWQIHRLFYTYSVTLWTSISLLSIVYLGTKDIDLI